MLLAKDEAASAEVQNAALIGGLSGAGTIAIAAAIATMCKRKTVDDDFVRPHF